MTHPIFHKSARLSVRLYIISLLVVSLLGSFIAMRGKKTSIAEQPTRPFSEVSFSSQQDNLKLDGWYFQGTADETIVIVHGWGGNRATFLNLAEYLNEKNFNVLTFDLRGGTGRNTYGQHEAKDIAGAVEWLAREKNTPSHKIILFGNSMGGAASIHYAADHTVKKLLLLSPVINLASTKKTFAKDWHLLFPTLYANGITLFERLFYGLWPTNPIDIFDKITEPTLILTGTNDDKVPVKDIYQLEMEAKTRNQDIIFTIIPGASHTFFYDDPDNRPKRYQTILDFIQ